MFQWLWHPDASLNWHASDGSRLLKPPPRRQDGRIASTVASVNTGATGKPV
jgi:hypothetical protein